MHFGCTLCFGGGGLDLFQMRAVSVTRFLRLFVLCVCVFENILVMWGFIYIWDSNGSHFSIVIIIVPIPSGTISCVRCVNMYFYMYLSRIIWQIKYYYDLLCAFWCVSLPIFCSSLSVVSVVFCGSYVAYICYVMYRIYYCDFMPCWWSLSLSLYLSVSPSLHVVVAVLG